MSKRRKKRQGEKLQRTWTKMNLTAEVAYIIGRAREHEARFVTLGPLVFFSTWTGDAWMLDPGDGFALCLARDGSPQPARIMETEESFAVAWDRQYRIEGDTFTTTDQSGQVTSFLGYPTLSIREAIRRAVHEQLPE